ncbi:MAG: MurR/RpiR family transcriptional regulator [Oscillospiraceae bacterium]|jgi:DNA-binding MurR/RpiR family transcriptional regulator|nr:MurR/RpiR family transcriptional regulator [Oscillospiraceae bacterium]
MLHLSDVNQAGFTKADHLILNYIMSNENIIYCETASEISGKVGVSLATVGRFWPKIGFDNFKEFKKAQITQNSTTPVSKVKNTVSSLMNSDRTFSQLIVKNIDALEKTLKLISPEALETAARLIVQKQKVYVFAPDASYGIAQVMRYRLRRFGIELIFIDGGSSLYESLNNINQEDLVLVFCFSRVLAETTVLLQEKQSAGFSCVIFSDLLSDGLQDSEAFLYCYRGEPTEYHSMVSIMAVVDSLIIKIAMESNDSMARINQLNDLRNKYQKYIRR